MIWHSMDEKPTNEKAQYLIITKVMKYKFYKLGRYSSDLHKKNKYEFDADAGDGFYDNDPEWGDYKISDVLAWAELPDAADVFNKI